LVAVPFVDVEKVRRREAFRGDGITLLSFWRRRLRAGSGGAGKANLSGEAGSRSKNRCRDEKFQGFGKKFATGYASRFRELFPHGAVVKPSENPLLVSTLRKGNTR
jgi:hypothetical protein